MVVAGRLLLQAFPGFHLGGNITDYADTDLTPVLGQSLLPHVVDPDIAAVLFQHPVPDLVGKTGGKLLFHLGVRTLAVLRVHTVGHQTACGVHKFIVCKAQVIEHIIVDIVERKSRLQITAHHAAGNALSQDIQGFRPHIAGQIRVAQRGGRKIFPLVLTVIRRGGVYGGDPPAAALLADADRGHPDPDSASGSRRCLSLRSSCLPARGSRWRPYGRGEQHRSAGIRNRSLLYAAVFDPVGIRRLRKLLPQRLPYLIQPADQLRLSRAHPLHALCQASQCLVHIPQDQISTEKCLYHINRVSCLHPLTPLSGAPIHPVPIDSFRYL